MSLFLVKVQSILSGDGWYWNTDPVAALRCKMNWTFADVLDKPAEVELRDVLSPSLS